MDALLIVFFYLINLISLKLDCDFVNLKIALAFTLDRHGPSAYQEDGQNHSPLLRSDGGSVCLQYLRSIDQSDR